MTEKKPRSPRRVGTSTRGPAEATSRMMVIGGLAFAFVGLADLALLWFPPQAGNVAWEYATVGRTLDSLPMPTLGLLLVAFGVLNDAESARTARRLVSLVFLAFGIVTSYLGFLVLTSAPAVLSQTPPEAIEAVRRSATRHGVQAIVYPLAWFAIAIVVWKAGQARRSS